MNAKHIIITILLIALAAPAMGSQCIANWTENSCTVESKSVQEIADMFSRDATIVSPVEIIRAEHREGNCVYSDGNRHIVCDVVSDDVSRKIQDIVAGNPVFKFDTQRKTGGLITRYGLAWQMPSKYGNLQNSFVIYKSGGVTRKLAIRDRCWYNLEAHRAWCPATVLMDGMNTNADEFLLV